MVINNIVELCVEEGYIPYDISNEPITLDEAKTQCRAIGFTDDDDIITQLIFECRIAVEKYTMISIVQKLMTLTIDVQNKPFSKYTNPANWVAPYNEFELPNGPVLSVQSLTYIDSNNNAQSLVLNTDYYIRGKLFKSLRALNNFNNLIIVYSAGYINPPADLVDAILKEIAFRYDHRGDDGGSKNSITTSLCPEAMRAAKPFRRHGYFN